MAIGDTYILKDRYTFLSEEMENVYLYTQTAGSGDAHDLADAFEAEILPFILEVQHANAVHNSFNITNQDDPGDFFVQVLTTGNVGLVTGETLPKFNAWGFRKNRSSTLWRNGAIRIGGVGEGSQDGGVPTSGALEDLDTLAARLGAPLEDVSGNSYDLKIGGKPTTPGGPLVPRSLSSVDFIRMTTQNSRKR